MRSKYIAAVLAISAAALYAINVPFSKILLEYAEPTAMAAFLYLGAGTGMLALTLLGKLFGKSAIKEPLTKKELPYTLAMIILDIAAPIFLMLGIKLSSSASVSLLNNFEIVATTLIAFAVFKEAVSKRLSFAIFLVTVASIVLGFEGKQSFSLNIGSVFVLLACICWGFENNCTKMISSKSSVEIVIIKGCFSGLGSLAVSFILGEEMPELKWILCIMLLGFVAYGLSINFYIMAQKHLGAAKTSAFYSVAPFLGVGFSMLILKERPSYQFYIALVIMIAATALMIRDTVSSSGSDT